MSPYRYADMSCCVFDLMLQGIRLLQLEHDVLTRPEWSKFTIWCVVCQCVLLQGVWS